MWLGILANNMLYRSTISTRYLALVNGKSKRSAKNPTLTSGTSTLTWEDFNCVENVALDAQGSGTAVYANNAHGSRE